MTTFEDLNLLQQQCEVFVPKAGTCPIRRNGILYSMLWDFPLRRNSTSRTGWANINGFTDWGYDSYGFNGLPAGCYDNGGFSGGDEFVIFWSSNMSNKHEAHEVYLEHAVLGAQKSQISKKMVAPFAASRILRPFLKLGIHLLIHQVHQPARRCIVR